MSCDAPRSDAPEQDDLRHDLLTPLTAISAQIQLLQRRVLRADGLSTLERELMLDTIASTMASIQQLNAQLERVLSGDPASAPEESADANAS